MYVSKFFEKTFKYKKKNAFLLYYELPKPNLHLKLIF